MGIHLTGRQLKATVRKLLVDLDLSKALDRLDMHPARRVVNPLFALMLADNELLRWRAVSAMGHVIATLYTSNPESARVIMRRLMWSLNDESGGIGWGAPEAMADAMARSEPLAHEYGRILLSYANPRGNYLEHPVMQQGLAWGLGRFARAWPGLAADAPPHLAAFLTAEHPTLRGRAAWAAIPLTAESLTNALTALIHDTATVDIYRNDQISRMGIHQLACKALAEMNAGADGC